MLDEKVFKKLRDALEERDRKREHLIKGSRDVLKLSKRAIYALHRDEPEDAATLLAEARKKKESLEVEAASQPTLRSGSYAAACAEYVEAAAFHGYISERRIPSPVELGVTPEEYLLGLADLAGELARRAVLAATKRDKEEVERIRTLIETLYGHFVTFDFRNGELRRKYDSIKYHLQKVEEILYELRNG